MLNPAQESESIFNYETPRALLSLGSLAQQGIGYFSAGALSPTTSMALFTLATLGPRIVRKSGSESEATRQKYQEANWDSRWSLISPALLTTSLALSMQHQARTRYRSDSICLLTSSTHLDGFWLSMSTFSKESLLETATKWLNGVASLPSLIASSPIRAPNKKTREIQ